MGEVGQVVSVDNERVTVILQRKEACAKCRACSVGMKSQEMQIKAVNKCSAKVGDNVEIVLEEMNFVKAVLIMYGFPFLFFLLGVFGGYYGSLALGMGNNELIGFVLGMLLVSAAYLIIKSQEDRWRKADYVPMAVNVVK